MEGIVVINKPQGVTSHDIVAKVRRRFKIKRVGHAGTLDPLATGVLIILVGKATKLFDRFVGMDKAYVSTMRLGQVTDSADIEGRILEERPYDSVTKEQIEDVLVRFTGDIEQLPPMFSAVKHKGKKLYELARKGITVERAPRKVRVHQLELISFKGREVAFSMDCSKGTYVRQLAHDIGEVLGCGACISQIERTRIGDFKIEESVKIEDLDESHIRHWERFANV